MASCFVAEADADPHLFRWTKDPDKIIAAPRHGRQALDSLTQQNSWEGHNLTMLIQSGVDRSGAALGVPYGSYARFILLFLQSPAIKSGSREIELGRSMRVWLGNMGLSIGGTTYRLVTEQARRISGCTLTFYADRDNKEIMRRGGFVDGAITMADVLSDQPSLWHERVLLNEEFYHALQTHPCRSAKRRCEPSARAAWCSTSRGTPARPGQAVPAAMLAHTSPLTWEHIGFSGDFLWDRAAATAGRRRPLNLGRFRAAA